MKWFTWLIVLMTVTVVIAQTKKHDEGKLKATATLHSTTLTWVLGTVTGGTGTITATNIYTSATSNGEVVGTPLATVNAPATSYVDTAVVPGGTKFYKATSVCPACSNTESPFSNETSGTTPLNPGQPQPPTGLIGQPQ